MGEDGKTLCGQVCGISFYIHAFISNISIYQVLDVNMVSEPKAHLTKTKAVKRQKEKVEGDPTSLTQGLGGPLLAYYMAGGVTTLPALPNAKRARVEEGDSNDSEL